tara:strand:+ start:1019 stop:1711 length:693 start_codon:yes stop_codon:yes gene_type:complete
MINSLKTTITALSALLLCTLTASSQSNANSIIGDLDRNGRISRPEAENMMNTPSLKSELFNASAEEQGRFYNALENSIRVRLLKLSRAYNTPRWPFAVEMCQRNGLSAIDAEKIALAVRANVAPKRGGPKAKLINDGTPVIADQDGDGRISRSEAENMMKSPSLKSKLFNASADDQSRFYDALESNIRVRFLRLSRAYETARWSRTVELYKRYGLSAQDAEKIATTMQNK